MQIVGWCILIISARTLNCCPMREFRGANRGGGRKKSKNLHSKITENMPRTTLWIRACYPMYNYE